jgi:hypothetical protein
MSEKEMKELYRVIHEALSFYATEWDDQPDGPTVPTTQLLGDMGDRAMAALSHLMRATQ